MIEIYYDLLLYYVIAGIVRLNIHRKLMNLLESLDQEQVMME